MADDKRFLRGLFKDTAHIDQPKGSWRYAKNLIVQDKEGSLSNEGGTEYVDNINNQQDTKVVGYIEINNNKVILFTTQDFVANPVHRIVLFDEATEVATSIYNPNQNIHNLNFSLKHPIQGTYKVNSKDEVIVYWTDDYNPPRAMNITRQLASPANRLYGILPAVADHSTLINTAQNFTHANHIDLLNLFPNSGPVPHIDLDYVYDYDTLMASSQSSIIEGGGLRTGVYYLALAYVDEDYVSTNFLTVSNPVSIVDEFDFTRPTTRKDGAKDGNQTSKAIKWKITNLNTDYEFVKPVVIRKMGQAIDAYKLNDVDLQVAADRGIVFSGVEGFSAAALEEVVIDTVSYDTAKTIQQLDNVLYLGNLTGTKDVGYQKYANAIRLKAVVKPIPNFDTVYATIDNLETGFGSRPVDNGNNVDESRSYRWAPNIFKYKGYLRDEVYAFYIAFIMKDGSMSYAYHIPGREAVSFQMEEAELWTGSGTKTYDELGTNLLSTGSGIEQDLMDISTYSRNFHWYDFNSGYFFNNNISGIDSGETNNMQYWQNATEFYPNTSDFEVWDENGFSSSIQDTNVRHHHFPSNSHDSFKSITASNCEAEAGVTAGTQDTSTALETGCFWARMSNANDVAITNNFQTVVFDDFRGGNINLFNQFNGGEWVAQSACEVRYKSVLITDRRTGSQSGYTGEYHARLNWSGGSSDSLGFDEINDWGGMTCAQASCGPFGTARADWFAVGAGGGTIGSGPNTAFGPNSGSSYTAGCGNDSGFSSWFAMDTSDKLFFNVKHNGDGSGDEPAISPTCDDSDSLCGCNSEAVTNCSWVQIEVRQVQSGIDINQYADAKVEHDVQRLGFTLDRLRIPRSIADKVQGFKIYYAKREHVNKRILGQSLVIPAAQKNTTIGLCAPTGSATVGPDATTILQPLNLDPEQFYNMNPWPLSPNQYQTRTLWDSDNNQYYDYHSYKVFSFYDFTLLRTKDSLAGATHIKPEYRVAPFVFNGPGMTQDRKMNTRVVDTSSDPTLPLTLEEVWGHDPNNCFPPAINSAITIGCAYTNYRFERMNRGWNDGYMHPRLLGQKAKSYILGDSIFRGQALGFGGKLFNEFGVSHIALGIKDGHELDPNPVSQTLAAGTTYQWGLSHASGTNFMLVNPNVSLPYDAADDTKPYQRCTMRIVNLHAFKTDVYKSIDSQKLVWTGFEVLGEDMENFVFEEDGTPATFSGNTADYSVETLQDDIQGIQDDEQGIFGGDTFICRYAFSASLTPSNPDQEAIPLKGIHSVIVESQDNISFRHIEDDRSLYWPGSSARDVLQRVGTEDGDFNHVDNIKYNDNYSAVNDLRVPIPLPLRDPKQTIFSTRVQRSVQADTTSLIDNWRVFLANQYKDLPKNRGELWSLAAFNNLLYFHMEESLYAAKGKQTMSMGDGSEAFVGSGDIFQQNPDEVIQADGGYGGTVSKFATYTSRNGYFFVDRLSRKVFLMKESLAEISNLGMEAWFRDNIPLALEKYVSNKWLDNPTFGFGFHVGWDPKNKRILLTKRDLVPTAVGQVLIDNNSITFNEVEGYFENSSGVIDPHNSYYFERKGWTISFFPELGVWTSFHSYIPYAYFKTDTNFYSFTDNYDGYLNGDIANNGVAPNSNLSGTMRGNNSIWRHNNNARFGNYYQDGVALGSAGVIVNNFEVEFIHNETKATDAITYSFNYTLETFNQAGVNILNHGFTDYHIYNTHQIFSSEMTCPGDAAQPLEYLINTRRIGNEWKINKFRDLADLSVQNAAGGYYMSTATNVAGGTNSGTLTTSHTNTMFLVDGMSETLNPNYFDACKAWNLQKKFTDKWIGIRLICSNYENNLLNLYSTSVEQRKFYR